ncbi:ABC transporter ATP-binding protein [Pseudomonas typographi]|uniref:ABC transporter ATP-binding protein n=1 Tax=Pseudomonas typographi TaxID=2715964 RepID=A0ABR7Z4S4_9PSED|nr:ABC transporter ATP-binding protein [Pseudomonas typographi]MBD1553053.1 ABC transporter ATP-binding protein [Pseudomonas typographi]MBD1588420.1 ABC transporter ATP-binding protein [Pseudomonas typographi]MBD1600505.1 ABC transporter ATP-binding protein [Pseudomonas typographi]
MSHSHLRSEQVSIRLGEGEQAFDAVLGLDFSIEPGQFVCILGPSGCGKSTLLGALAGHLAPSQGVLYLDGEPIVGPSPQRGMVFQHHTLLPWRRVLDNVAFGLKMQGLGRAERQAQAREMLDWVGLAEFARHWPRQLSGGMQQRAEIARVLVNRPRVLLMDEPFGALDALTRARMQQLLLGIWARVRTTVVFVTHDIDEALLLGDRVLVMSTRPGRLIADLPVPLMRSERQPGLEHPALAALKRQCLALLHPEHRPLPRLTPLGLPPDFTPSKIAL